MPCSGCGSEFGIFKKEHSCKNCGFSFCGNCLSKKAVIPKLGNQSKHGVCGSCFHRLSGGNADGAQDGRITPPKALQRRMNELQSTTRSGAAKSSSGNDEDQLIASRLENLRKQRQGGPIPSTAEIETRLAKLKGLPVAAENQANMRILWEKEHRSNAEQATELFRQMEDEAILDAKQPKPEEEIAQRLAMLKQDNEPWNDLNKPGTAKEHDIDPESFAGTSKEDEDKISPSACSNLPVNISGDCVENMNFDEVKKLIEVTSKQLDVEAKKTLTEVDYEHLREVAASNLNSNNNSSTTVWDNDTDEDADDNVLTEKLIRKLLAEQALDDSFKVFQESKESNIVSNDQFQQDDGKKVPAEDELPWCNICNEDAAVRCQQCDGELYCNRCFKECHDSFEIKDHRTIPYK